MTDREALPGEESVVVADLQERRAPARMTDNGRISSYHSGPPLSRVTAPVASDDCGSNCSTCGPGGGVS